MKTVWKYTLSLEDEQIVKVPLGAELLSVQTQYGEVQLWALVDDAETVCVNAKIIVHGTGHPADDVAGMKFLGTFQGLNGAFVGHCWGIVGN